ncbi:MAG TPA: hypothetical protein VNG90_03585 [Candidatus Acidoferrum sp.]|nr:hypothetical protein [Candidatus Acidoferrum sp.]
MKALLALLSVCCLVMVTEASALASVPTPGITASPALEQLSLKQGQSTLSFTTQVTNNTNVAIAVDIHAQDFTSLNQNGGVNFLGSNDNPHGLASSMHIGTKQLKLEPGQSQTLNFTITDADALSTGGHYGAIVYRILGPDLTPYNTVTVNQAVTTLVFLTTASQGTQELKLASPVVGRYASTFPTSFEAVFANTGNTQTAARGLIQILDHAKKVVSQGVINADSGLILPGSERLFAVNMRPLTTAYLWPGVYTAKISYHYLGQTTFSVEDETFLYVGWQQIVLALFALLLLLSGVGILLKKTWLKRRLRFGS